MVSDVEQEFSTKGWKFDRKRDILTDKGQRGGFQSWADTMKEICSNN